MKFVPLEHVAQVQLGKMLSPKSKTGVGSFPYLRNQNVQWQRFKLDDLATMDFSEREREKFRLLPGDLLICEGGEPGRCAVWQGTLQDCYYQKALHRVRPNPGEANSEFLAIWIRFQAMRGAFDDQNAKTTIAHLPLVRLLQLQVPDLPIDAQSNFAERLQTRIAVLDGALQAAEEQLKDTAVLRIRVLKELFAKAQEAPFRTLGDFAKTTSGSTPQRENHRYWKPAELPWVKTGEVDYSRISTTEERISKAALEECSLSILPPETVLVAMYGQGKTRGQCAILDIEATTNQACFAILPNATWNSEFLFYWFMLSYQDLRNLSENRGGNQANLNGGLLNALKIPAPPKDSQEYTARRAEEALREIRLIETAIRTRIEDLKALPTQLIAEAFEG